MRAIATVQVASLRDSESGVSVTTYPFSRLPAGLFGERRGEKTVFQEETVVFQKTIW